MKEYVSKVLGIKANAFGSISAKVVWRKYEYIINCRIKLSIKWLVCKSSEKNDVEFDINAIIIWFA